MENYSFYFNQKFVIKPFILVSKYNLQQIKEVYKNKPRKIQKGKSCIIKLVFELLIL